MLLVDYLAFPWIALFASFLVLRSISVIFSVGCGIAPKQKILASTWIIGTITIFAYYIPEDLFQSLNLQSFTKYSLILICLVSGWLVTRHDNDIPIFDMEIHHPLYNHIFWVGVAINILFIAIVCVS